MFRSQDLDLESTLATAAAAWTHVYSVVQQLVAGCTKSMAAAWACVSVGAICGTVAAGFMRTAAEATATQGTGACRSSERRQRKKVVIRLGEICRVHEPQRAHGTLGWKFGMMRSALRADK